MPAVYNVSSYLEKPTEQEISMKWVANVNLIPVFWKDMNIVTDGPADPASSKSEPAAEESACASVSRFNI